MQVKSFLRLRDSWLDVTPGMPLRADQVAPNDERAWQRDIKKFRKKATTRPRNKHELRETSVVRIPSEAGDGYFQLVLCQGPKKKVLGNSPVFRVLSTSTAPSSIRGASLSTLPVEVGAMVLSVYAQTAARTAAAPAAVAIQARVDRLAPSRVTKAVAQKVYTTSGAQSRVGGIINGPHGPIGQFQPNPTSPELMRNEPVSIDVGPQPPYPMSFKARCLPTQSLSLDRVEEPSKFNLTKIPEWITDQLRGYYFGWARYDIALNNGSSVSAWRPAILSVRAMDPLQAARVNLAQIAKRTVALRLLHTGPPQAERIEVRILGYLRAEIPPPTGNTSKQLAEAQATALEAAMLADVYDTSVVQDTLAHPAWAAEHHTLELQQNTNWIDRTQEGFANIITRGQKLVEQVPLHKIGVRSVTDEIRESQIAVNGYFIVR